MNFILDRMRFQCVVFIQLVFSLPTENPNRDKIKIVSCENPTELKPEMTFVLPASLIPEDQHFQYQRSGDTLKKVVDQSEMKIKSNDDCKFIIM